MEERAGNLYALRLTLELNEESGVYTVTSPDVPGLVTEGVTSEEIQHNIEEALQGLLAAWAELGKEIPPALQNSRIDSTRTVQLLVTA